MLNFFRKRGGLSMLNFFRKNVNYDLKDDYLRSYDLKDGYLLSCESRRNAFGGGRDVNVCLYEGKKLIRRITDEHGAFLDFPGIEHGEWEKNLKFPFEAVTNFTVGYNSFDSKGLADFVWLVQPDGRYWADEDGFGIESTIEIELYAKFDKTGRFVTPFCDRDGFKKYK